ncbi:MAG: endolytic transglycosylase MltG [Gemmatimonadaceae bacterium]|nr:endolytic transglycosylase MltG [Gemmatimonadaceae bacterium]
MARRRRIWPAFLTLLLVSAAAVAGLVMINTRVARAGVAAKVVIPNGATLGEAADSLRSARVIRSATVFQLVALFTGDGGGEITYGRYFIRRGAGTSEILAQLHSGAGRFHRLTIPEGWAIQQIARLMRDSLGIPVDSIVAASRDSARRARMQTPAADVEGYLFPATYDFIDGTAAGAVVDTMLLTFDRRWKSAWDTTLRRDGRARHAVVTLASIVEKEAGRSSDRPMIAAVYMNRLRQGMRLQADPTVLYAMGLVAKRVMFADLRIESPYNTYRVSGLPPGPIASPGTASIAAAVQPADTDVMFFVAFPDGHSQFTHTFAEHSAAVKVAHAARDSAAAR